jgi:hypothetical protein
MIYRSESKIEKFTTDSDNIANFPFVLGPWVGGTEGPFLEPTRAGIRT